MGDNLPPGVSTGDPYFNPPDMAHEHEWESDEEYPIFEDEAAIFMEQCQWEKVLDTQPGYEGDRVVTNSIPCEEQQRYRFEPVSVRLLEGDYTITRDHFEDEDGELHAPVEQALHDLAGKSANHNDITVMDCDPDPEMGNLIVRVSDLEVTYVPTRNTNRSGT